MARYRQYEYTFLRSFLAASAPPSISFWAQCYKKTVGCNLQMFVIRLNVFIHGKPLKRSLIFESRDGG
jgi:hypothetical protein